MLMAKNSTHEWCFANTQKKQEKESFYCPSCFQPVYLKNGQNRIAHFAHFKKCQQMQFTEGETLEHMQGKLLLQRLFSQLEGDIILEPYLSDIKQRPDLLYRTKNRKLAIEFQCSPITAEKLFERTEGYREKGYDVIWFIGQRHAERKSPIFLYTLPHPCLLHLSVDTGKLWCISNTSCQPFTFETMIDFCQLNLVMPKIYHRKRHVLTRHFLNTMYAERIPVLTFPPNILNCSLKYQGLKSSFAELLSLLYYTCKTQGNGHIADLYALCHEWITKGFVQLFSMPLADKHLYIQKLIQLALEISCQLDFIYLDLQSSTWKYIGSPFEI